LVDAHGAHSSEGRFDARCGGQRWQWPTEARYLIDFANGRPDG
jgi:hypothetical protein